MEFGFNRFRYLPIVTNLEITFFIANIVSTKHHTAMSHVRLFAIFATPTNIWRHSMAHPWKWPIPVSRRWSRSPLKFDHLFIGPSLKISCKSVRMFLRKVPNIQTNEQLLKHILIGECNKCQLIPIYGYQICWDRTINALVLAACYIWKMHEIQYCSVFIYGRPV